MVEGSRCFASGEPSGAAAAGPAGSTGSSSMTRRCIFRCCFSLTGYHFRKGRLPPSFLTSPKIFLKVCFSKIFQDFSISSRIFRNLSLSKEGDLLFLLLPRSSKVCLFQDVPKFSKTFQNFPKGCFSQNLLRVFNLFFYFHDFPKLLLGAFLTFQKYSEILQEFFIGFPIHFTQGIGEEGSFDFRFDSQSCCICIYPLCVWLI